MLKQIKSLPRYIPAAYELISSSVALYAFDNSIHKFLRYHYNDLIRLQDRFASEYGLSVTAKQAIKKFIICDVYNKRHAWNTFALAYAKFSFTKPSDYRFKNLLVFRNLLVNIYDIPNKGTARIYASMSWLYLINTSPKK